MGNLSLELKKQRIETVIKFMLSIDGRRPSTIARSIDIGITAFWRLAHGQRLPGFDSFTKLNRWGAELGIDFAKMIDCSEKLKTGMPAKKGKKSSSDELTSQKG